MYKRQVPPVVLLYGQILMYEMCCSLFFLLSFIPLLISKPGSIRKRGESFLCHETTKKLQDHRAVYVPVSYTHLDVYKSQPQSDRLLPQPQLGRLLPQLQLGQLPPRPRSLQSLPQLQSGRSDLPEL